jgi:capsular polysaccharide biosynthesis protein
MGQYIQYDAKTERLTGPHDFDQPPKAPVAANIIRPPEDVAMRPLKVYDPHSYLNDKQREQCSASSRHHPEVSVIRLRNALVSGNGVVLTEDTKVLPESNLRYPHVVDITETGVTLTEPPQEPVLHLRDNPVFAFNGVFPIHYGHWVYDNFSRLGLAQDALGFRPYSVLTGYKKRGGTWLRPDTTQGRMLSLAGVGMGQIQSIKDQEWCLVDDLVVVSPLNNFRPPVDTIYSQPEMFEFLGKIGEKITAAGKGHRIYCSRRDTPNRMMKNEAELVDILSKRFGFVEVMLGEHSLDEQVAIFRDADIVAGPIGNAFMNMAYMKKTALAVVFLPPEIWHFLPYYQTFSRAGGVDVHAIVADPSAKNDDAKGNLNDLRWQADSTLVADYIASLL